MKHQYLFLLCLLCMLCDRLQGQSLTVFDLYQYNYSLINPAYTGAEGSHKFSATGKGENLGETYPVKSWMLAYEAAIKKLHSGIGVMATKDHLGPYCRANIPVRLIQSTEGWYVIIYRFLSP